MENVVPKEVVSLTGVIDTYKRWKDCKTKGDRKYHYYHPSEWGKAQPYDSLIQTPNGPVKMGHISVGDKICGPRGDSRTVIQISPQGVREIYEVVFSNGDTVECCGEHLWEVNSDQLGFKGSKVESIKVLYEKYIKKQKRCLLYVEVPSPLFMEDKDYGNIPPYLMGVILGDGCLRCNSVDFTSVDIEIVNRVKDLLLDDYEVHSWKNGIQHRIKKYGQSSTPNIYKKELNAYGLRGIKSEDRYIPQNYLFTSIKNRWDLVRGLMDTDGTIDSRGYARFSTKSQVMASQFKWLIESLGGICNIRDKVVVRNNKEYFSYRCDITISNTSELFYLSRKKDRGGISKHKVRRFIKDVRKLGRKECQCIAVDNFDGLYLTDQCIITHNCLRQQQYKHYTQMGYIQVEQKPFDSKLLRLFDKGHNMHERWSGYFDDIGNCLLGHWRCKNLMCRIFNDDGSVAIKNEKEMKLVLNEPSRLYEGENRRPIFKPVKCVCGCTEFSYVETPVFDDRLKIRGSADLVLNFENLNPERFEGVRIMYNKNHLPTGNSLVVGDMKTASSSSWKNQIMSKGPYKEHLVQITFYVYVLGADYGLIMYENKDNSELAWFQVKRNQQWWDLIQWQAGQMVEMRDNKLLPPPKAETKKDYMCLSCPYKSLCHKSKVWEDVNYDKKRREFYQSFL